MPSYHIQYVDAHGPYLRKSWYEGEEQQWEHIGPLHTVDPGEIPDETVADIREEGYGLARYRENVEADVFNLDVANSLRDELIAEFGDDVLAPNDDRRDTIVKLAEDADPDAERVLGEEAAEMQAEQDGAIGQVGLTDDELGKIDFTKQNANVPHAQAAKAALLDAGISNWTDHYEPETHADPHGHASDQDSSKERAAEQGLSGPGDRRLDNDESEFDMSTTISQADSEIEKHAIGYVVREEDETAMETLQNEFGYSEGEVEALAEQPASAAPAL